MSENPLTIEQGPVRPPSEWQSLPLRVTRNCPWNQCLFCRTYKKKKFSLRTVQEILKDIDAAREIAHRVEALSWRLGADGAVNEQVIHHIFGRREYDTCFHIVALWMYHGTRACFLQDADNLIMNPDDLIAVLQYLREKFPQITRITTYARSRTVARRSVDALIGLRKAGLKRVHLGLETGHNPLLKFIKKGVSAAQHVEAGKKLVEAGMEVSDYVMPGLGGREMWRAHAIDTARVLNQIHPHFIRLRSLRVLPTMALSERVKNGNLTVQGDDEVVTEIKLFIQTLDGIRSMITSDHIINLLEDVQGTLPQDKEKMVAVIDSYQDLPESERLNFRVGRRGGAYRSIADLKKHPATYKRIANLIRDIRKKSGMEGLEHFMTDLVDRYI